MTILEWLASKAALPVEEVGRIAVSAPTGHTVYAVPKRSGGLRRIAVPPRKVLTLQRHCVDWLAERLPIHECAMAYRRGRSIRHNADRHARSSFLLKLDFKDFFPSIGPKDLCAHLKRHGKGQFDDDDFALLSSLLFWRPRATGRSELAVGAASSPLVSNTVMFDFDRAVERLCSAAGIAYTRYSDDITLSSDTRAALVDARSQVGQLLAELEYPKLSLNGSKTVLVSKRNQRRVTGLILSNDDRVSLGRDRKRLLRAAIQRYASGRLEEPEIQRLRGWLAFAIDVEPNFVDRMTVKYGGNTLRALMRQERYLPASQHVQVRGELISRNQIPFRRKSKNSDAVPDPVADDLRAGSRFRRGDRVVHAGVPEWGIGEVIEDATAERVVVHFSRGGRRTLALAVAQLQPYPRAGCLSMRPQRARTPRRDGRTASEDRSTAEGASAPEQLDSAHASASGERQHRAVSAGAPAVAREFDLLLFDLDDTLLKSSHLESFRGTKHTGVVSPDYVESLRKQAAELTVLFPQHELQHIRDSLPGIKLGIFTRAPREYAGILLTHHYPGIEWDCVVAYEDVTRTKPHPDGIRTAAAQTNVAEFQRVALVGDEKSDIIAAYQAGCAAILSKSSWGADWSAKDAPKRSDRYDALDLLPDAIIQRADELHGLLTSPSNGLPALESWQAARGDESRRPSMRIGEIKHFNNLELDRAQPKWVTVATLGRYFASHKNGADYDFRLRSKAHELTKAILDAKDGNEYPESWVACCVQYVLNVADHRTRRLFEPHLVVCTIPARPGRPARLERLLERIEERIGQSAKATTFNPQILRFKEGVRSNKELGQQQRYENIRDHLEVADPVAVKGRWVIVIDDMVTSGATFYYADQYLQDAGARRVICVALTKAIS